MLRAQPGHGEGLLPPQGAGGWSGWSRWVSPYHEGAVRRGPRDAAGRRRHGVGGGREEADRSQVKARDEVRLQLRARGERSSVLLSGRPPQSSRQPRRRAGPSPTHAHGGHVVLVGFPHFLHDLLLCFAAVLDGALHRDGPFGVVQSQVLQADGKASVSPQTLPCPTSVTPGPPALLMGVTGAPGTRGAAATGYWDCLGCQGHRVPLSPGTGTAWSQSEWGPASWLALGSPLCLHPKPWLNSKTPVLATKSAGPELCSPEGMGRGHHKDREGTPKGWGGDTKGMGREIQKT